MGSGTALGAGEGSSVQGGADEHCSGSILGGAPKAPGWPWLEPGLGPNDVCRCLSQPVALGWAQPFPPQGLGPGVQGGEGVLGWGHLGSASPAGYCWARETALSRSVPPCCAPQTLLQEEPSYHLDTTVRQQAMLAISSMRYLPYPSPQLGLPGRYQLAGTPGPRSKREADSRAGGAAGFSPPEANVSVMGG